MIVLPSFSAEYTLLVLVCTANIAGTEYVDATILAFNDAASRAATLPVKAVASLAMLLGVGTVQLEELYCTAFWLAMYRL